MRVKQSHLFGPLAVVEVGLHGRDRTCIVPLVWPIDMGTPLPAWSIFDFLMKKRRPSLDHVMSRLVG